MFSLESLPKVLFEKKNAALLSGILRGVEREALRTDLDGKMSLAPHPQGLGSALTHPQITTDFSESLLEFITPPTHRVEDLFAHLEATQKFVLSQLDNEILWGSSMPCVLSDNDNDIPVAHYGKSNNGQMKTIYRIGLGHRYGRAMQTVAGVHYNFSLPNAFWAMLSREQNRLDDLQAFKDEAYFKLIRNFRRHYWLLIYLFGASPALCSSFVNNKEHGLHLLPDQHTLHLPYATSLRMGDLGYQSTAQESLYVCYNEKMSYIKTLCRAITSPHSDYDAIGLKNGKGHYQQLNTSLLQIENEFYSSIRPKRTTRPGETALSGLSKRGVEYIEVRCLDVNPFAPLGIEREQVHFLDVFLLYCALQESPMSDNVEFEKILHNQKLVVNQGRQPGLKLEHHLAGSITLESWGKDLIEAMRPAAEILDLGNQSEDHQASLDTQLAKISDPNKTPSARVLHELTSSNQGFSNYALDLSKQHQAQLRETPLPDNIDNRMQQMAEESLAEQASIEAGSTESFDEFIQSYYKQYSMCSKNI